MKTSEFIKLAQAKWRSLQSLKKLADRFRRMPQPYTAQPIANLKSKAGYELGRAQDPLAHRQRGYIANMQQGNSNIPNLYERMRYNQHVSDVYVSRLQGNPPSLSNVPITDARNLTQHPQGAARRFIERNSSSPVRKRYEALAGEGETRGYLYRGMSLDGSSGQGFKPGTRDIAWGGGYFGGKVHHATPSFRRARAYTRTYEGTPEVINVYKEAPRQKFARDFSVEKTMGNPRSMSPQQRPLPRGENTSFFETAISPRTNRYLGSHLYSPGTNTQGFIAAGDKRALKNLGHYMKNTSETVGPSPYSPNFRQTGVADLSPRLKRIQETNLPLFDQLMARRADRYVLPR